MKEKADSRAVRVNAEKDIFAEVGLEAERKGMPNESKEVTKNIAKAFLMSARAKKPIGLGKGS